MSAPILLVSLLCACDVGGGEPEPGDDPTDPDFCEVERPGRSPMRRLTSLEYSLTIQDLLGVEAWPGAELPADNESLGFDNQADTMAVTPAHAEGYLARAEEMSALVAADLEAYLPCDAGSAGCAEQFIAEFGARAFRGPLDDAEVARLMALFGDGDDFADGIQRVVESILQSPRFLYRVEFGGEGDGELVPVDGYEAASRLSYLLWMSMPDDELFAAAAAGELSSPDQIEAQARRMLDDARARRALRHFGRQWLRLGPIAELSKSEAVYPEYDAALGELFAAETEALFDDLVWQGQDIRGIFTARHTFLNAELADFYGVDGPTGSAFERVELDAEHAGVLTHASILAINAKADQSSPIHRGKWVRERLLCQALPDPPPGINVDPPPLDPELTTRERFAQHVTDPACSGCHQMIDPIGFGFEKFDGVGRFRSEENDEPIDDSGELIGTADIDGAFDGVVELGARLAGSTEVADCIVQQAFRFSFGRELEADDTCTAGSATARFVENDHDLRELFIAFTQTDAFLYKNVEP